MIIPFRFGFGGMGPNAYEWQYLLVQGCGFTDGAAPFRLQQKNDKLYFYAEDSGQGSLFTVQTNKWYHLTRVHTDQARVCMWMET